MNAISENNKLLKPLSTVVHLIKNCIKFYGCLYEEIIKDLLILVNQIRMIPTSNIQNIGELFFNLLLNELKAPGTAFRNKILEDFPEIEDGESKFINSEFYLISSGNNFLFGDEEVPLNVLRKLIILQIISVCGDNNQRKKDF